MAVKVVPSYDTPGVPVPAKGLKLIQTNKIKQSNKIYNNNKNCNITILIRIPSATANFIIKCFHPNLKRSNVKR